MWQQSTVAVSHIQELTIKVTVNLKDDHLYTIIIFYVYYPTEFRSLTNYVLYNCIAITVGTTCKLLSLKIFVITHMISARLMGMSR